MSEIEKMKDIFQENYVADEPIIKMRDVKISFKVGTMERIVINHLNLDIKRGEILGLVGESGSGKTTIGRAIMRINQVSGGEILYNNVRISGKINRDVERLLKTKQQMIFQDPGDSLNDRANIDYIVSEGLRAFKLYKNDEERLQKVIDMMVKVGLRPEHLTRFPHEFSGGQRQRIGIARCMIMNPELVVADEPISALDVSIRAQVLNLIKQFQQENNMTVLFIAHDLSVVKYISDRIAVIHSGKIVELTSATRLFEAPLHPYTKSLLSAVPIPDPDIESKKKIITYNPLTAHHYTKNDLPDLREIEPGHFVRCNNEEFNRYKKELERMGGNN
ncbi:MAG: ATP-binding cassette domain-containing protein [Bacilli bacterium]